MAQRRLRHDADAMLSIEGMGITPQKSLPVIVKRKSVAKNIVYRRRSSQHNKRLARLNDKRNIKSRRVKTSSKQENIVIKKSTTAVKPDPPFAPVPEKKAITLYEKALWLLSQKADPGRSGEVVVLYSHYRALFKVHNGMMVQVCGKIR